MNKITLEKAVFLKNYEKILDKIGEVVYHSEMYKVYKIKNILAIFYVELSFDFGESIRIMDKDDPVESDNMITILLERNTVWYEYDDGRIEVEATSHEMDPDYLPENFEKTIKKIFHLPSFIRWKILLLFHSK
jgi:hypothetical protein